MLESTNALIGALIAVLRELNRNQSLVDGSLLTEEEVEGLEPYIDQLHEALSDLSECYESRRASHPNLLTLEQLRRRVMLT